jgi:hypothetical protein
MNIEPDFRFITPAVVSPEIVDIEVPKDDGNVIRRGLMVIAKVFQNLANNIFFGKEAHMVSMNKFLEDNILVVTRFLTSLNVGTSLPFVSVVRLKFSVRNMSLPKQKIRMNGSD